MRTELERAASLGLLLLGTACHGSNLTSVTGALVFSSPDQPSELTKPDAGVVQIAFGPVLVGTTATMTLDFASLGSPVTLGTETAVSPDSEFSLPFVPNTIVGSTPSQITVSFAPTSAGNKTAVFQLVDYAPAARTVLFELSGEAIAYGLTVAPNPLDFGQVEINQLQSVPVTITNSGPLAESFVLSALGGPNADRFSLGAPSATSLGPGASATLDVTFGPLVAGAASASFTVGGTSPDQPPVTVNLSGIASVSWIQANSPLDFGFVQLGNSIVKSAMITNLSNYKTIHLVAPAPALVQPSAPFSLPSTVPAVPAAIAPGQSVEVPITFTPGSLQAFSGTLYFTTDDPNGKYPVVDVQGYGGGPHISCLPSLSFGPVALGAYAFEDSICTNTGMEIPSLPKLGLQMAQASLGTGSSAFVPNLVLPDGGLAGSGYNVSLLSGQQARIRVGFHPEDAGPFVDRLTVPSNDLDDADAGTLLLAEGGLNGSCDLELIPTALSFGEVPPGSRGALQFELRNTSQAFCTITHVGLDPESDPAFSLRDGGLGMLVLTYPGSTDTPTLSSSVIVEADFTPTKPEGAASGTIDVTTVNAQPPNQSIALTGVSEAACLSIEPTDLDFGTARLSASTQQLCAAISANVVAANECTMPVTVSQVAIDSDPDVVPQFTLDGLQLPLSIEPGGQASFQVSFVPTSPGPKLEALGVSSSEFPNAPFLVTLQGDAELTGNQTDTFVVPPLARKVDLLWILDEDDDWSQVQAVAGVMPQMIDAMGQAQIDYQIAVTSTDTCDAGASDRGFFEPCDHCLSTTALTPTFITPATPDAGAALVDLFNLFDISPQVGFCENLNGDEHFFDSIAEAFSPGLLAGHNSGFLRDGAYLAVVLVNGDAEDDAQGGGRSPRYLTSLAKVTTLMEGLKPDPKMVSLSYINSGASILDAGQKIGQLVEATGGLEIDTLEPAAVWQASLLDLFGFTEGIGVFDLTSNPASGYEIRVDVNGVPTTAWTYDASTNAVRFAAGELPPSGATVTVTYVVGCP